MGHQVALHLGSICLQKLSLSVEIRRFSPRWCFANVLDAPDDVDLTLYASIVLAQLETDLYNSSGRWFFMVFQKPGSSSSQCQGFHH